MPQKTGKSQAARRKPSGNLTEIARIGALFIDGDAAEDVHAGETSARWQNGDDINFKHAPFLSVKRTLLLIARMQAFPYDALFALRRADDASKLEAVVCGTANPHGRAPFKMSPAQRDCIRKGAVTTEADPKTGVVSAYAPVRNSDDEIVGLLHVFA